MLSDVKNELINNPEKLKSVLEHFGYCSVIIHNGYISCGRDADSSKKAIVIRLNNNPYLYVTDYARNINQDLFSYICNQRKVKFIDVLNIVKNELGITDYYSFFNKTSIFGGFYTKIKKGSAYSSPRVYDEDILDKYIKLPNARFLRDNISICSQKYFGIRYDIESQTIIIPIYDEVGQLIGVKARVNKETEDGEQKYYYIVPCAASKTLYGYCQNYKYLTDNTVYVFESEKSVLQCFAYGIRNCVALGSGTVSKKQAQMLIELNPRKIILMHDVGYSFDNIDRNINMIKRHAKFSDVELGYWDYFGREYEDKLSPSDLGNVKFHEIINSEIKMIGSDDTEEEI